MKEKKQEYLAPAIKVLKIESQQIICISGGTESVSKYSTEYNDDNFE